MNGGTCTDNVNGFLCGCVPGFTGIRCQTNLNECASTPCQHGGTCTDSVNGYTCACADGFYGTVCAYYVSNVVYKLRYNYGREQIAINPLRRTINNQIITSASRFFNGSDMGAASQTLYSKSSNTGYERVDTETIALVQDPFGAVSLVLLHDAPCNATGRFCPFNSAGTTDAATCTACDADGALIDLRITMARGCGMNGNCTSIHTTAFASDQTPYSEAVNTAPVYDAASNCCPTAGNGGSFLQDWYVVRSTN
jgi:hypothetical protein